MKRLRSSNDLDSYGKDPNPNPNPNRPSLSSHRSFYYKSDAARKGLLSSSPSSASSGRFDWDRSGDDDREAPRPARKRSEHDFDGFERRKGFDRYGGGGGESRGYDRSMIHRSESFCGPRRDFPKGFRSERDRPRREASVSSWRRFGGGGKEFDDGGGSRIRPEERGKGLRDVRSPTWSNSRDSGSDQSRVRSPPRGYRDGRSMSVSVSISKSKSKSKSPTWSKDSVGSEQSKCVELKKSDEPPVESGSSSEMEEGELQPEPEQQLDTPEAPPEDNAGVKSVAEAEAAKEEMSAMNLDDRVEDVNAVVDDKSKDASTRTEETKPVDKNGVGERIEMGGGVGRLPNDGEKLAGEESGGQSEDRTESRDDVGEREEESVKGDEEVEGKVEEKGLQSNAEREGDKGIDLEAKAEDLEERALDKETTEEKRVPEEEAEKLTTENLALSFKDKGKSVAVAPTHGDDSAGGGNWTEREAQDLISRRDGDMEGPSSRGFELFGSSPVRRQEKVDQSGANSQKDGKLGFEPLDLTLSLPNVLLPIGATPGSPGQARSVQSLSNTFCTNSDGFTPSVSFSGSQSLYHNPSCSLTQNSLDNMEQSVKSRPIFQGIDWQALSQNESKAKEVPLYQKMLMNGNGSQSHQQSQTNASVQSAQAQHSRLPEGSSALASGLERQLSFHKQLSGQSRHHDDVKSPSHSVGSHDIGSSYSFDRKRLMREKSSGSLYRSSGSKMDQDQLHIGGFEFVEAVIGKIVSEPIPSMAKKFHEMTGTSLANLKESIRGIMMNADKRREMSALQKLLQDRPDTTLEMLQKAHRMQLEILVALKTGLPDFLKQDLSVSTSDLAEIFMNLKCRNLACQSHVPVDECDCKVCGQKNGFCSACMCLVCSKFDMASNTCSWVGCDVCLHWCHADCGLRESYIRNGRSATGSQGTSEMQFHCVACDHPSEMFGFVKEVFQNFAKGWSAENFAKELEYVKRIFAASKDLRGKRLHEIAGQMLARLANKADLTDVYNYIMAFLNDGDSFKLTSRPISSGKEQSKTSNGIAGPSQEIPWLKSGPSQEPPWLKPVYSEKVPQLEIPASLLPSYSYDRNDKCTIDLEPQPSTQKEPIFDELESIVRIKLAEAKMFQSRADDARREAEGLQRIAMAKNEKIEEEYSSRISKLCLVEAEQLRKQKFEELQALERSHREYFTMKMRMEAEIKDLLVKMEATKRNLAA